MQPSIALSNVGLGMQAGLARTSSENYRQRRWWPAGGCSFTGYHKGLQSMQAGPGAHARSGLSTVMLVSSGRPRRRSVTGLT